MKMQKTRGKWPDAYCPIFIEQKEVTSRDCYIILGQEKRECRSLLVSNSEKKVHLLIKAASLHSDTSSDRNMKSHFSQRVLSLRFSTAFEIG